VYGAFSLRGKYQCDVVTANIENGFLTLLSDGERLTGA
jgi:hypothetical protein